MAYLTKEERENLEKELKGLKFNQANGRVRGMDSHGRLMYYRNAQRVGEWWTRYELKSLGVFVTLIEKHWDKETDRPDRELAKFELVDVKVEPTPDNRL